LKTTSLEVKVLKWEYFIDELTKTDLERISEKLGGLGEHEWELVTVETVRDKTRIYLKRPIK